MKRKWQKDTLDRLYNKEGKTLQEIGDIYGVTRERIRQVMKKLSVSYERPRTVRQPLRFKDIGDYLNNRKGRKRETPSILRHYLEELCCSLCGSTSNLHIHHIRLPARSPEDLQILCSRCHRIEHINGISVDTRQEIYNEYLKSKSIKDIAKQYGIAIVTAQKIVSIVRRGESTYRG